jgi:hypothetical protein
MTYRRLLAMFVAVVTLAAALSVPRLPGGISNLGGPAAAQQTIDVDYFYDALDPYGQWVWHPRYGYVWLPGNVREDWRPYTVGHWVYTDEYGWYWDSYEPFAWAVYHYGRWGYDPDYGWFWVPGDTWAPAWVNWRYSDNYTGWAPVGPGGGGYAYGAPVDYDPPVAESWVFVQPRYMTSRMIYHYALPVADLNIAFIGATNVYRPVYRTGVVFNFGIPRERVVKVVNRPIVVKKIVKVTNITNKTVIYKNGKRQGGGINVFAPNLAKGEQPRKDPRRFASSPKDIKAHAKLRTTLKGDAPKGVGQSAAKVVPISREVGPDGFKPRRNGGGDNDARKNDNKNDNNKNGNNKNGKQNEAKGDAQGGQGKGGQGDNANNRDSDRGKQGGGGGQGGAGQGGQDNKAANNKNDKDRNEANANDKHGGPGKGDLTPGGGGGGQNSNKVDEAGVPNGGPTKAPIASPATGAVDNDQGQAAKGQGGKKDRDNKVGSREPGGGPGQGQGKKVGGQGGGGQANIQGGDNGPGGPGKRKGQGGGGGQGQGARGQGGQQAEGGGGQGGGMTKAERCKKNPDAPACQRQ